MELDIIKNEKLKEQYFYTKHKTGLDIFIFPKKGHSKTYAVFATKYGSIDNQFVALGDSEPIEVPEGIAHFLEHKLFESENENENAFKQFGRTGANANAFTSFDKTAYLFSCTDHFEESLKILLNFVQTPYFTEESIKKEQGIIAQEIKMYEDNPDWKVFFNLLKAIYHNNPIKIDIAGTVSSIEKITPELLYKCYNTFYNPQNMVLCVCGDVDEKTVLKIADENLKQIKGQKVERKYPTEPKEIKQKKITSKLQVSIPMFTIGIKENDPCGGICGIKKKAATEVLMQLIAGESSSLYKKMYDEGLINSSFSSEFLCSESYGATIFGGESKDPQKVYDMIMNEIENFKSNKINVDDFNRCKKYLYGHIIKGFNSVERIANDFMSSYFFGINYFDKINEYENLDIEYATQRLNEHFNESASALSVVEPI